MRYAIAVLTLLLFAGGAAVAQPAPAPSSPPNLVAQKAALAPVQWLAGRWEGRGWIDMDGRRETFRQVEDVALRMDGALLVIEGKGFAGAPEAQIFSAFAVLSHDDRTGASTIRSHARGYVVNAPADIGADGSLVWRMTPPGMTIRYTITRPAADTWREVGERSVDGGAAWTTFFEMDLRRVAP